jgi:hypothetical protein
MFDGYPQSSMMEIPGTNFEQQDNVDLVLQSEILEPPQFQILEHPQLVNDEASAMINDSENSGLSEDTSEVDSHHEELNVHSASEVATPSTEETERKTRKDRGAPVNPPLAKKTRKLYTCG